MRAICLVCKAACVWAWNGTQMRDRDSRLIRETWQVCNLVELSGYQSPHSTHAYIAVADSLERWCAMIIVANRPGTPGTVPDLEALSWILKFTWIAPNFQGFSDRSGLSSFIEGHLALASVELWLWVLENKPRVHKYLYYCVLHDLNCLLTNWVWFD